MLDSQHLSGPAEAVHRALLAGVPGIVASFDAAGRVLFFFSENLPGSQLDDAAQIGRHRDELLPSAHHAPVKAAFDQVLPQAPCRS
ncbi:MAG: hypothetical protein HC915_15110 [Anaerolineae bacterium]|nr:hypothetical protein [Anaerolineae bacterium]